MTVSVQLSECEEGDILASDIYNREGVKLIAGNTMVNPYIIDKLIEQGIENVRVYDPPVLWTKRFEKIDYGYKKQLLAIKSIMHDLASGKTLDVNKINSIANSVYESLSEVADQNIIQYLSRIKKKDEYTYQHSLNVAFYSMLIGRWLNFSESEIKEVTLAGLLHDIGKIRVPLRILNKPAKLTDQEFDEIKKHPIYGYMILEENNFASMEIKRAVLLHHERINCSGYPFSISESEIDIMTRIVAVADVYDAMTSDRVYKKRATPFSAFEMFMTNGNDSFDSYVIGKFVSNMATMLTGSDVLLSNGDRGKVVYIPPHDIFSPIVCSGGKYISLADQNLAIVSIL